MIEHNILKAKTFINQSVARVRDVSFSRMFIDSIREIPLMGKKTSQSKTPAWILFARETLRTPRAIGTCWASSERLAQTIASFVPLTKSGLVVELGGGTGQVTEALLQHGIAPERLVSIEQSASMADYLRQRCPQIRVLKGDALHLCHLLGDDYRRVSTVVSGLPFRSLPDAIGHGIIKQIDEVLPKNGLLIQFTYDLSGRKKLLLPNFKHISYKIVWSNIPPARVDVYQKKGG
ncbi:methyltransferase domain-containing protein [Candidatus Marithioploca araucensis]|uniref:Methyltransferase domain-containing protein n=1 Tax=Candidatus Marithioploca araucensis TaxID=70273 RepID=A0ABT7VQB8_9GAMM|nr:methyltransferase domain-containing protein [Candidatus Marithioploca araucensis]